MITVKELVSLMNIYNVSIAQCSEDISAPVIFGEKKINMTHQEEDKILKIYGDFTVKKITNIAGMGLTIWI